MSRVGGCSTRRPFVSPSRARSLLLAGGWRVPDGRLFPPTRCCCCCCSSSRLAATIGRLLAEESPLADDVQQQAATAGGRSCPRHLWRQLGDDGGGQRRCRQFARGGRVRVEVAAAVRTLAVGPHQRPTVVQHGAVQRGQGGRDRSARASIEIRVSCCCLLVLVLVLVVLATTRSSDQPVFVPVPVRRRLSVLVGRRPGR